MYLHNYENHNKGENQTIKHIIYWITIRVVQIRMRYNLSQHDGNGTDVMDGMGNNTALVFR